MLKTALNTLSTLAPAILPLKNKPLENNLKKNGFACTAGQYALTCFAASLFSLLFSVPFLYIFNASIYLSLVVCAAVFLFLSHFPAIEAKRIERQAESALPLVTFLLYCDVASGAFPEAAIAQVKRGKLAKHFGQISELLSKGLPFSLVPLFYTSPCKGFEKLLETLSRGNKAELEKLYDDLLHGHIATIKAQAAKASMASMFFISIAAVVPALFAGAALLGNVLGFTFTPLQVFLLFAIVFPAIDAAFLYYLQVTSVAVW